MYVPTIPEPAAGLFWVAPWVALLLVIAFALAPRPKGAARPDWRATLAAEGFGYSAALAGGIACLVGLGFEPAQPFAVPAAIGFLAALVMRIIEAARPASNFMHATPWAMAAFVVGILERPMGPLAWIAIGFGACSGAMVLGASRPTAGSKAPALFGLAVILIGSAGLLGVIGTPGRAAHAGVVWALAIAVACGIGAAVRTFGSERAAPYARIVPVVLLLLLAKPLADSYFETSEMLMVISLALLAACVAGWSDTDDGRGVMTPMLGAIAWIAVATIAFAQMKGYGVALAALAAVGALTALGSFRAIHVMMPLFALALFRVFRQLHPETIRALDLGQHYAIIGILAGILLVLGPIEWVRTRSEERGMRTGLGAALLGIGVFIALAGGVVLLGAKGAGGLIIGFGLAGLVARLQGSKSLTAGAWGAALALSVVLAYAPLQAILDLTREEKLGWLMRVGIAAAVPIVVALVVGGRAKAEEAH